MARRHKVISMKVTEEEHNNWRRAALEQGFTQKGVPLLTTWIKAAASLAYASLVEGKPKVATRRLPEPPRRRHNNFRKKGGTQPPPKAKARGGGAASVRAPSFPTPPPVRPLARPCEHVPSGTFCKRCGKTRSA